MENLSYKFFMSQFTVIRDIKENEKIKISIVLFERTQSTCILRVCKNRDLTSVCDAISQIKSPHLAYIIDYVYANKNTYIIEEKLSGLTVEEYIEENGVLSEKKTAEIIIAVCNGVTELHKMKPPVIHNDINPSNIMICDDSNIKLFDFDISRTFKNEQSQNTTLFGTDKYASPEHYGYGQSDVRSDIYCLGVTMHKMLTGQYLSDSHQSVYKGKLKRIIDKCIEFDPKNRYSSVQALKSDLQKFLSRKTRKPIVFLFALCLCITALSLAYIFKSSDFSNDAKLSPSINQGSEAYDSLDENIISVTADNTESDENTDTLSDSSANKEPEDTLKQEEPSEQNDETEDNSQSIPEDNNTPKKMKSIGVDGEIISMVVLNNGTLVYLEKKDEEYHLRTLSGIDNILMAAVNKDCIELAYNSYTGTLYTITIDGDQGYVYLIDDALVLDPQPIYTAKRSQYTNITANFFSDGIMFCNAFEYDLIDTEQWCEVSDYKINRGSYFVANDRIYYIYSNRVYEIDSNEEVLSSTLPPNPLRGDVGYCDNKYLYIHTYIFQGDSYISRFDGTEYTEVICLNDYKYFSTIFPRIFAVSDEYVWMYDEDSSSIKEFKIE